MVYALVIAPYVPPINAAESIQIGRLLEALDTKISGRIIAVEPVMTGWTPHDASLQKNLQHFDHHYLTLPLHRIAQRIIASRIVRRFHVPDTLSWIIGRSDEIIRNLPQKPNIIYSRSYPMSAALLSIKLQEKLGIPWIMHLSDPWVDNPYRTARHIENAMEETCFARANHITLTTQGQAEFYQRKYPQHAAKISVSPNTMPEITAPSPSTTSSNDVLNIVYAGNLYGDRSPEPLLNAIAMLEPDQRRKLHVTFYGNCQFPEVIKALPETITYRGAVPYAQVMAAQAAADVLLSIEPENHHPLASAFLPSKVPEALALRKPLLAITPKGSTTESVCHEGYGWAVAPAHTKELAARLNTLIYTRPTQSPPPPARFAAAHVASELLQHFNRLVAQ
ncbi:MAG: glycosyltransferase [Alphaproteobacteria bacterium]|nr:glycosyltransferase [Alphaproteobacteria bacterium]